ncbi:MULTISPECIES: acyl carrier protein [unclassified Crossiella]|uniref:acyl carrier protein n=1 Tax=unclassified Crossiella TaxID=2620835 RepID=UPI001FFF6231|nr:MULTISPECIES: acyl carrier protein [unclassified Crossiella]MCK2244208.1 acyl carrier protein [Crossiella sp. S99.2]MCK2258012.1 acyl carrier protein [Crossiella sp. S99.1]
MNETEKQLHQFIAEVLLPGEDIEFDADTPLLEYRLIDSLNVEQLMVHVEHTYAVSLERHTPSQWNTIRKMAALIQAGGAGAH